VEGMQAYCIECAGTVHAAPIALRDGWLAKLVALVE
jgi:hypothetical protein